MEPTAKDWSWEIECLGANFKASPKSHLKYTYWPFKYLKNAFPVLLRPAGIVCTDTWNRRSHDDSCLKCMSISTVSGRVALAWTLGGFGCPQFPVNGERGWWSEEQPFLAGQGFGFPDFGSQQCSRTAGHLLTHSTVTRTGKVTELQATHLWWELLVAYPIHTCIVLAMY